MKCGFNFAYIVEREKGLPGAKFKSTVMIICLRLTVTEVILNKICNTDVTSTMYKLFPLIHFVSGV